MILYLHLILKNMLLNTEKNFRLNSYFTKKDNINKTFIFRPQKYISSPFLEVFLTLRGLNNKHYNTFYSNCFLSTKRNVARFYIAINYIKPFNFNLSYSMFQELLVK